MAGRRIFPTATVVVSQVPALHLHLHLHLHTHTHTHTDHELALAALHRVLVSAAVDEGTQVPVAAVPQGLVGLSCQNSPVESCQEVVMLKVPTRLGEAPAKRIALPAQDSGRGVERASNNNDDEPLVALANYAPTPPVAVHSIECRQRNS